MNNWTVIGAGPAGIAAVGNLLDRGCNVSWIDESFNVGNFSNWSKVPSNTRVELFIKFLKACHSFGDNEEFDLFKLNPDDNCELSKIIDPLVDVTNKLTQKIPSFVGKVKNLDEHDGNWIINMTDGTIHRSKNVVLATGGTAKSQATGVPLSAVLNVDQCKKNFNEKDVVTVIGSSHSAILAIKNLLEVPVEKVINYYRHPLKFAVKFDDHILYDDSGLKGEVALWAKNNLVNRIPERVERICKDWDQEYFHCRHCTKVVFATGFYPERIKINTLPEHYDARTGIIAPCLFGCGFAYPELYTDRYGNQQHRIGLWKFMDYLQRVIPIWLRYSQ